MKDRPITRRRADVVREEPPATAIDVATSPIPPPTPPLRVGTTAWRAADPGARLTHEFHLALPCRPVHVGLIGAALTGVRIEDETPEPDCGVCAPSLIGGPKLTSTPRREVVSFKESSIESTDNGIRVDYELTTPPGLRENLVCFIDFEVTLRAKGQVTILLIFESPAMVQKTT